MAQGIQDLVVESLDDNDDDGAWVNSMRNRFSLLADDGPFHEDYLICRVHPSLRKQKESAYEPVTTSIGPYHRGKKHLQAMEPHKQRYLRHLLSRNPDASFANLVKMMKTREERVRSCYPEGISLDSDDLVEMILLDGCFIVELLLKYRNEGEGDDVFVGPPWRFFKLTRHDLLLLENQLPFFVLQDIFQIVCPNEAHPWALVQLSLQFLKREIYMLNKGQTLLMNHGPFHHLLHLLHAHLSPNSPVETQESKIFLCFKNLVGPCLSVLNKCCWRSVKLEERQKMWMPSATKLQEDGVELRVGNSNLLDIKFYNGVMEIPYIHVQDETDIQFRNLIAFEQCCLVDCNYYFSSYALFMDCIINTSKDVELLHNSGILTHALGNYDEVASLFSDLLKEVIIYSTRNYLFNTENKVNEYSNSRMHKWRASLARDYFYSPWAVLSFIAAILILSFTSTQTIFSILSYINPH